MHLISLCSVTALIIALGFNDASAFAPSAMTSATASRRSTSIPRNHPFDSINESNGLKMSQENGDAQQSSLPVFLDPGTKGGAVVLSILLFVVPIIIYQVSTNVFGLDEIETGRNIGVGFSVFTMLLWGSTYIFRVATKDMTYAKQLKDYEDAVIQKRLEELDEDEVQALVEDIEREEF